MIDDLRRIWPVIAGLIFGLTQTAGAETLADASGRPVRFGGKFSSARVVLKNVPPRKNEFRGVWVATVGNIDFPAHRNADEFMRDFRVMTGLLRQAGFTAIIFQIRTNCDAFYPSKLAPWSRWLTGREGAGLANFDPLKFMVEEAHRQGLEFHAWFNPYRVIGNTSLKKKEYLATLHPDNFARRNPQWVLMKKNPSGNQLFLDPGVPQVVKHLSEVVAEVTGRYGIDAVHFDDYFYPYEKLVGEDAETFRKYNPRRLKLDDWRRSNTKSLIVSVRKTIDRINAEQRRRVRFGVSPFGIWANQGSLPTGSLTGGKESYSVLFADTRKWVKNGFIDYIIPQIYWNFGHETAAYAALGSWWCSTVRGTGVKLYIGIGAYNAGKWGERELINQVRFNRMHPEISGAAFFSFRSLFGKDRSRKAVDLLRFLNDGGR